MHFALRGSPWQAIQFEEKKTLFCIVHCNAYLVVFSLYIAIIKIWLFTNYASQCTGQRKVKQGQAGTRQGQTEINRDKQGHSLFVPACPYLFMVVLVCPCLSLLVLVCSCPSWSVPICPCMSLSIQFCLYICYTFLSTPADEYNSLHQYEHSYIEFPCKSHCSNACQPSF